MQPSQNTETKPYDEYNEGNTLPETPVAPAGIRPVVASNNPVDTEDPDTKRLIASIRRYAIFTIIVSLAVMSVFIINNHDVLILDIDWSSIPVTSYIFALPSLFMVYFPVLIPAALIIGSIGLLLLKKWGRGFLLAGLIGVLVILSFYILNPYAIIFLIGSVITSILGALTGIAVLIILIGGFKIIKNRRVAELLQAKRN